LTRPLAERAQRVVAYEIDRDLASELRTAAIPRVEIVEADFLTIRHPPIGTPNPEPRTPNPEPATRYPEPATRGPEPATRGPEPATRYPEPATPLVLRVAGNLPYNVASPILFKLLDWSRHGVEIADATVMLQQEVADRLLAAPGSRDYGVLTVLVRHRADVEPLLRLPPGAFRPPPRVHSAVVRLRFHEPDPPVPDEAAFERVVKRAFAQRRKMLSNALIGGPGRGGSPVVPPIDLRRRAETLTVAEYAALAQWLRN
jgi:16S rRNA (adenine1518-N6/adenine1519-N6)-dimethyltransferase